MKEDVEKDVIFFNVKHERNMAISDIRMKEIIVCQCDCRRENGTIIKSTCWHRELLLGKGDGEKTNL